MTRKVIVFIAGILVIAAAGCGKSGASAGKGEEATLPDLNRALGVWIMSKGAPPADLNQLTNFPTLTGKRLPTPPPGKKLALDPKTRQIGFVDQ